MDKLVTGFRDDSEDVVSIGGGGADGKSKSDNTHGSKLRSRIESKDAMNRNSKEKWILQYRKIVESWTNR